MTDSDPVAPERRLALPARIAIVFAGATAIWFAVVIINDHVFGSSLTVGVRLFNAFFVGLLAVALVVAARRWLDRRPLAGLALPLSRAAWRPFLAGLVAFAVPSVAGVSIAVAAGWMTITPRAPTGELLGMLALVILTVLVYEAIPEELLFRGYFFRNLVTAIPPWAAALVQAGLFTLFGTALWVVTAGWGVFVERLLIFLFMSLVLGLIRIVSGSVWACVGFHLGFQVIAQTLISDTVAVDGVLELFAMLPSFVLGTAIVALIVRRRSNWTRIEPDPA